MGSEVHQAVVDPWQWLSSDRISITGKIRAYLHSSRKMP